MEQPPAVLAVRDFWNFLADHHLPLMYGRQIEEAVGLCLRARQALLDLHNPAVDAMLEEIRTPLTGDTYDTLAASAVGFGAIVVECGLATTAPAPDDTAQAVCAACGSPGASVVRTVWLQSGVPTDLAYHPGCVLRASTDLRGTAESLFLRYRVSAASRRASSASPTEAPASRTGRTGRATPTH